MYSRTYFSKEDLLKNISTQINPLDLNKIESAYEMADNALFDKISDDGNSLFFHSTRVCQILVNELHIYEPELIIASLMHEVSFKCTEISGEIISFNFGHYVSFLVEISNEDIEVFALKNNEIEHIQKNNNRVTLEDYLILKLTEILDKLRCIDPISSLNPILELSKLTKKILPFSEKIHNPKVEYLTNQIKIEKNKYNN